MSNKVAVVTGGSSGIGLATCRLFAKNNFIVVLSDVNDEDGRKAVEEIKNAGGNAIYQHTDVSKFEEVEALINKAVSEYGRVDVLINNAGIGMKEYQKAVDHSIEEWHKVIAINQSGVFYGLKFGIDQMIKQGGGNIVNVASIAGLRGNQLGMSYTASKFAVVGMTKSAALEYGKKNIRVNCICPGFTQTNIIEDTVAVNPEFKKHFTKQISLRRYADPAEIAEGILWLATDKSSYVNGHALLADGGLN